MTTYANDQFKRFFTEKIWAMIPSMYRLEDGIDKPDSDAPYGVLHALVEVWAEQAAILRRSQDQLWDDQFIDLCAEWAVPYLADLLGTRMLSALNPRGRRIDVAKTIYYRRRKGTPRVLEELIADISGWDGVLVENFRRLARARHGLDPQPAPLAGTFTGTLPGGWANLRSAHTAALTTGPFDELAHTPDMRRPRGRTGQYGIPKITFYLYRLVAYRAEEVTPYALPDGLRFTFDPSGRDVPLFGRRRQLTDWDDWQAAREWDVPAPIRCRLLQTLLTHTPGTLHLATGPLPADGVSVAEIAPASLQNWPLTLNPPGKTVAVDAERGRFQWLGGPPPGPVLGTYHAGFSGPYGAGTYSRPLADAPLPAGLALVESSGGGAIAAAALPNAGVARIADSRTYGPVANKNAIRNLTVQAQNGQRPYLRLATDWRLQAANVPDATLTLDGLWLGGAPGQAVAVALRGTYECVVIRNCTLDPGGDLTADGQVLNPVRLLIEGTIETLCIDHSIVGPVVVGARGLVETLIVTDSVVQSVVPAIPALSLPDTKTTLTRTTVLGDVVVHTLSASEVIVTGLATVRNTQTGCFRFSAALHRRGLTDSRLPRPYESWLFPDDTGHWFASRRFGQPAYAQLSESAPEALRRGAENGSELGAFSALLNPIKHDSLTAKVAEYMPFGLIPSFVFQT
jgi:hypothetical protein